MEQFYPVIGRFHPLFVHLPIGILCIAVLLDILSFKKRRAQLKHSLTLLYAWGTLTAILSCITGFLLAQSGEYESQTVNFHQSAGIAVAATATTIWLNKKWLLFKSPFLNKLHALSLVGLLFLTGHLGGSLTHGADYLTQPLPESIKRWLGIAAVEKPVLANVQEAVLYRDIVVPILAEKCYKCHNQSKQKGKLRLDSPTMIQQGGKSQKATLVAGRAQDSEMLRRVHLATSDEKHMPPKSKPQLSDTEIELLTWWINSGASYDKAVRDLPQSDTIATLLKSLENGAVSSETDNPVSLYAGIEAKPASVEAINQLKNIRAVVLPVEQNSNLLSVNFVNVTPLTPDKLALLLPLQEQVVWLRLSEQPIRDEHLEVIQQLKHLKKLYLDYTNITNTGLQKLSSLSMLTYLNVVGTELTSSGIEQLKTLPQLKQLYIFKTKTTAQERLVLIEKLKPILVDTGGYAFPNATQNLPVE